MCEHRWCIKFGSVGRWPELPKVLGLYFDVSCYTTLRTKQILVHCFTSRWDIRPYLSRRSQKRNMRGLARLFPSTNPSTWKPLDSTTPPPTSYRCPVHHSSCVAAVNEETNGQLHLIEWAFKEAYRTREYTRDGFLVECS